MNDVTRKPVWNSWGTVLSESGMTSGEALAEACLDWDVYQRPISYDDKFGFTKDIPNQFVNVRDGLHTPLGIVGDNYKVLQNRDAFQFGDDVLHQSGAHWITAGSQKQGKTVWMTARLPESLYVGGLEEEAVEQFLVFSNSHDGSSAVRCMITPVRAWCQNTLTLAVKNAHRMFKIRHTQSLNGRLVEARKVLELSLKYSELLVDDMTSLLNESFSMNEWHDLLDELFPMPDSKRGATVASNNWHHLNDILYETPDLQNIKGTKYGALQAVIEWNDHHVKGRGVNALENKFDQVLTQRNITHRAYDLLSVV